MNTIWKYELHPVLKDIGMPRNAKVLTAAAQGNKICVWAEVDPDEPVDEVRHFEVFGTGHVIPKGERLYIGTAFLGAMVFHVYELNAHHEPQALT